MASMASLLMLLAITFPIHAIYDDAPYMFPQTKPKAKLPISSQIYVNRIKDSCPPLGPSDEQFKVKVLGSYRPPAGGCASMQPDIGDIVPSFDLWLGNLEYGVGSCEKRVLDEDMHHYVFKCLSKHTFMENGNIVGWYVALYNQAAETNNYRCSLYKILNEEPAAIKLVVSANEWCDGLSEMLGRNDYGIPDGHATNGSFALLFAKDWLHPFPPYGF